jgi:predicted nucleotidyltransferase
MERVLNQLVEKLQKAYQDRLTAVVLYGSAAAGEYHGRYSDFNILCVLREITPRELADAEPVFHWWRKQGNPSPLLFSEEEIRNSSDCFPIEFHDIKERNRLLAGRDVVSEMVLDKSFYRAQVEHELRAKLLRLRQKAGGVLSDGDLLRRLLVDSVSTFCMLMRHSLLLDGVEAAFAKREVLEQAREHFGIDPAPFLTLLDVREERIKPRQVDAASMFERYLKEIHTVIDAVDRMAK